MKSGDALLVPSTVSCPALDAEEVEPTRLLRDYVRSGQPVLVRGGVRHWKAVSRWSDPDYLASAFGDTRLPIRVRENGNFRLEETPLSRFFSEAWQGTGDRHCYLEHAIATGGRPGPLRAVADDIEGLPFVDPESLLASKIFAGWNTRSGLHYHPAAEAMLCQIVGKKRVILFSPARGSFHRLYPAPWYSQNFSFSRLAFPRDGSWPDMNEFPGLAGTRPIECVLEPGDMLYIPIYWWHVVFGLETSISVNYLWKASLRNRYFSRLGLRSNYLNRRLLRLASMKLRGRSRDPALAERN